MHKTRKVVALIVILGMAIMACSRQQIGREKLSAEIAPVLYDRDAIVTIISDDGFFESGSLLSKLAQDFEMHVTISGYVEALDNHRQEWKELEQEGNIEIISHSYSHNKMSEESNLSGEELEHEIKDSIAYCKKNFFTSQIAFVPPENTMCQEGYELLKEAGIYAIRQGSRGLNSLSPEEGTDGGQWYNLLTHGIGDVDTTDERNQWVEDAIDEKAWLIEMWHNVSETGEEGGYQEMSIAMAKEHISYVSQKENEGRIWVASMTDATKYIYEKQNSEVEAAYFGEEIEVELSCNIDGKNKRQFSYPLTISIQIPDELNDVKCFRWGKEQVRIIERNGNRYILLEMLPNTKCKIKWEMN